MFGELRWFGLPFRSLARLAQKEELECTGREPGGGRGLGQKGGNDYHKNSLHFRVDWTPDGESIVEHVAGVEDYQVAAATYRAACQRWPSIPITLRQGARVIQDSRRLRTA
jgi:hypothetical protein